MSYLNIVFVDVEIWSPLARLDWITNGCLDNDDKVALHKL